MPTEYRTLLNHEEHMTVAVEAYHGCGVNVRVLESVHEGVVYTRSSLLVRQSDGGVVQLGIMRIDMRTLSQEVKGEIESRSAPLGRILIRHGVLRHVELERLWRVRPGRMLQELLVVGEDDEIFGRSARIVVDGLPAVELLEIPKA